MYGHQVIEDLLTGPSKGLSFAAKLARHIREAQHFHFDERQTDTCISQSYDEYPFSGPEVRDKVRLPYRTCWFDWTSKRTGKMGAMAYEFDTGGDCFHLTMCLEIERRWVVYPTAFVVALGKSFSECRRFDQLREFYGMAENEEGNIMPLTIADYAHEVNTVTGNAMPPGFDKFCYAYPESEHTRIWIAPTWCIAVLHTALLLLNCRNIVTERVEPSTRVNKKRARLGKQPLFSYHTLVIKPVGNRQESIPKYLWNTRLHLCRGHFKTYTAERPLFGSIVGRFWWQPQVRGSKEEGVVMKDYEIRA